MLMAWIHDKITGYRHRDVIGEALAATDEATNKTRSVRQQLQPYALEDDPFAAILTARSSAQSYQEDQLRRIIEEPPRE